MKYILPKKRHKIYYSGLKTDDAQSFALSQIIKNNMNRPHLIITDTVQAATNTIEDLSFFLDNDIFNILYFPNLEILPYDILSASENIISERLNVLNQISKTQNPIVVVSISTLLKKLPPIDYLEKQVFIIKKNQIISLQNEKKRLNKSGYQVTHQVTATGEFSIKGSVLDIFPVGAKRPYRIDFFDDEVENIQEFDIETRSIIKDVDYISILPKAECVLDDYTINIFKENWSKEFNFKKDNQFYQQILKGQYAPAIEFYLPLFFSQTSTIFDYFNNDDILITHIENTFDTLKFTIKSINDRYSQMKVDGNRKLLHPDIIYNTSEKLGLLFKKYSQYSLLQNDKEKSINLQIELLPDIQVNNKLKKPYKLLLNFIEQTSLKTIVFSADSVGRVEILKDHLIKLELNFSIATNWNEIYKNKKQKRIFLVNSPLQNGFIWQDICVITESLLFHNHTAKQNRNHKLTKDTNSKNSFYDLSELQINMPIVHLQHGIGEYKGLITLNNTGTYQEFLSIMYAKKEMLYVPLHSLYLISRYSHYTDTKIKLSNLGTDKWQKDKLKTAKKIKDVAAELLTIYANRESQKGYNNKFDKKLYLKFCKTFPYKTTPDQQKAIDGTIADMRNIKPMDRLICGDVGFGKTEVAIRAAFIAVSNGRQVAYLVPTTLLARQQYENFQNRFIELGINVNLLSRNSGKEQKDIINNLKNGFINIIIGTQKLLSKDVRFSNLGLLIIDEEHRFGVEQKEQMKAFRANIDILTMTATPIPRTLNMAMSNMRDMSIISTAPAKRLCVKTFVKEYNNSIVKEAVMREILRGGQVFYLHNSVDTLPMVKDKLLKLFPTLNIAVAHGRMVKSNIEQAMYEFKHNKIQILLCTTIIETGLDIPNANTIIIDRADLLGLAQLHQLRGRVGRASHQAYAYMLTPNIKTLNKDTQKRLKAISETKSIGGGFMLANHDLEIRGAGEILGAEQSGNIQNIGFNYYMELLNKTIKSIEKGENLTPEELINPEISTEIELRIPSLISKEYIKNAHERLSYYKKFSEANNFDDIMNLKQDVANKYGRIPQETLNLFTTRIISITATDLGIKKIHFNSKGGFIEFFEKINFKITNLINLVQKTPNNYKLSNDGRLTLKLEMLTAESRILKLKNILDILKIK